MSVIPTYTLSQSWSVQHFDTEDGLPGKFKLYDSPLISNNEILKCGEAMGMIWFYTFGGNLFYIENDKVKRFEQNIDAIVGGWMDVDDNTILIASSSSKKQSHKIQRIKRTRDNWSVKSFRIAQNNPSLETFGRVGNQVYILACNKIFRYDNTKDSLIHVFLTNVSGCIGFNSKLKDKISYPKDGRLHIFDGEVFDTLNFTPRPTGVNIRIFEDSKNRYWFTGDKPMLANSLTDTAPLDLSELLEGSLCNEITEDNEGNIWFSTNSNGIYVLYNTAFSNYTSKNSALPNDYIYDIDGDKTGNVFIATKGGMLTVMNGETILDKAQIVNLNTEIYDVNITGNEKILVAQNFPYLFGFDSDANKLKNEGIIYNSNVKRFMETADSSIVLVSGSVSIINHSITSNYSYPYTYPAEGNIRIYAGIQLPDGFLLGSNLGVLRLVKDASNKVDKMELAGADILVDTIFSGSSAATLEKHQFESGQFINDYIADMKYARDSSIWIASRKNGIYHIIDNAIHHHYTASETGLTSNLCTRMYIDSNDKIWVATMNGISLISPKEKNIRKITTDDGLISNHVNSVYVHDSLVYAGTSKGLTLFHEADIKATGPRPPISINEIKINEADIPLESEYNLAFDENTLLIKYIGLSYKGKVRYKYRLKGLDDDWVTTSINEVRFPELRSGNYDFEVKSITKDGIESTETAKVHFKIKSHPLYSSTALILYTLLLFGSIFAYYQWRIWSIKKKEREKTAINKKFAELELQALQAQMNPHFVFNALGAIQNFILQKDDRTANRYLSRFGQLMRLFLESSKEKYITLNDELQLLQLYVDLERLRFDNKFDYHVDIPDTINPYDLEIPSLTLT